MSLFDYCHGPVLLQHLQHTEEEQQQEQQEQEEEEGERRCLLLRLGSCKKPETSRLRFPVSMRQIAPVCDHCRQS